MKPTVLLAEGDSELCHVFQRFLRERGYEVETAKDGLDCLAKLRQMMPTVLVLDRELHWGGGDGVLAWLREHSDRPEVAVVLTATSGHSHNHVNDIKPPVVTFLPKPFTLSALFESVQVAVARKEREEPLYSHRAAHCSELFIG
jgi:DNA-binding NtrC family response regulator